MHFFCEFGVQIFPITLTGQLADLDTLPEVTVKFDVLTPDVEKVFEQDADEPEHAPVHV